MPQHMFKQVGFSNLFVIVCAACLPYISLRIMRMRKCLRAAMEEAEELRSKMNRK